MDWHQWYFLFAGLNLAVCLPLHLWLSRFARIVAARPVDTVADVARVTVDNANLVFVLIVLGFSLAGFVSAATLFHMVPMLGLLGLGTAGIWVASLLGPAQVASRLINMGFGNDLPATVLAVVSTITMPLALVTLAITAAATVGAIAFAIVFGLGSGLFSIVSGTLPLAIFGRAGFGKRLAGLAWDDWDCRRWHRSRCRSRSVPLGPSRRCGYWREPARYALPFSLRCGGAADPLARLHSHWRSDLTETTLD